MVNEYCKDQKELFELIEKRKDMLLYLERLKKRYENKPGDYFEELTETLDWLVVDNIEKFNNLCNYKDYNKKVQEYAANGSGENVVIMDLELEVSKVITQVCKTLLNHYNRMKKTQAPKQLPYKDFVCQDLELAFESGDIEIYTPYEIGAVIKDLHKAHEQANFETLSMEGDASGKCKVNSVWYGCRDKKTKRVIVMPKIGFAEIKENVLDL